MHLGGRIVSKTWLKWTGRLDDTKLNWVHITPKGKTINPHGHRQQKIHAALDELDRIIPWPTKTCDEFFKAWQTSAIKHRSVVSNFFESDDRLSEPALAYQLSRHVPSHHGLFLGNSTPIRD
ncbi:MAG: hypothetical protein AAGA56_05445, partial [Myxococcota bacterium]